MHLWVIAGGGFTAISACHAAWEPFLLIVLVLGVILCWLCFSLADHFLRTPEALPAAIVTVVMYGKLARMTARSAFQIPAYQAYPASGEAEPSPLPNFFIESVAVRRTRYLTLL